jgi:hypothetical protein
MIHSDDVKGLTYVVQAIHMNPIYFAISRDFPLWLYVLPFLHRKRSITELYKNNRSVEHERKFTIVMCGLVITVCLHYSSELKPAINGIVRH